MKTGADYNKVVHVINEMQFRTAGNYAPQIKPTPAPGRTKAESLAKAGSELWDNPDQYTWTLTETMFGSPLRIEGTQFARDHTLTLTQIAASDWEQAKRAVADKLRELQLPNTKQAVARDARPGKDGLYQAKLGFESPQQATDARERIIQASLPRLVRG